MDNRYGRSFSGGSASGGGGGGGNSGGNSGGGSQYRRYSRSRSRSRERSRDNYRRRDSRSRSRERSSHYRGHTGSADKDLYRDLINEDYKEERPQYGHTRNYEQRQHHRRDDNNYNNDNEREQPRWKGYEREQREQRETRERGGGGGDYDRGGGGDRSRDYRQHNNNGNNNSGPGSVNSNNRDRDRRYPSDEDSDDSDESHYRHAHGQTSNQSMNTIIVFGLEKHITEADIMGALIQVNMAPSSVRLIRKKPTGASRGFAFVDFNTVEEATHWMEITQGVLQLQDQRVSLQYSHKRITDWHRRENWHCINCGVYNFKRRFSCFKCNASRAESENPFVSGSEGNDEVSNILTKKIMLRNLDALTNEEGVLTAMQLLVPDLVKSINKVLVSRDTLTQTSRGICYLNFETLIDSMNVHNALTALEPPLQIDSRDVSVSYCIDAENRQLAKDGSSAGGGALAAVAATGPGGSYTLADVPRLAEYSASLYASNPAEHAHYFQYYTDYYITEIKKGGQLSGLPSGGGGAGGSSDSGQLTEANSGAAVALSAIQRKQKKMNSIETTATAAAAAAAQAAAAVKATFANQPVATPKGNDGKTYPTPDVSQYQYDETSGYYYDPSTGLYYDAHSQYYYNNETGAYLYWDQRRSSYILATPASTKAALKEVLAQEAQQQEPPAKINDPPEDAKKEKTKDKEGKDKPDKVKVAKKIVKDMEKWAKQLNQKKDYTVVATPQPIFSGRGDSQEAPSSSSASRVGGLGSGAYADVGFSILEKKERAKLNEYLPAAAAGAAPPAASVNKLVNAYGGGSESEEDSAANQSAAVDEMDYVDFQKLTCLLCKRAFQSLEVLQKHLKMSNLHKENLAKLNSSSAGGGAGNASDDASAAGLSYRDRAKERRKKYGEFDPPPPNRSRERFEHEIKTMQTRQNESGAAPAMPISSNNVGNRLLQKMGWSEGQGLGRKNQGRTQIIEADARSSNAGLGTKGASITPGDDYKTYIKKMMKSRYENA